MHSLNSCLEKEGHQSSQFPYGLSSNVHRMSFSQHVVDRLQVFSGTHNPQNRDLCGKQCKATYMYMYQLPGQETYF